MWRISKKAVLTRKPSAIETLGSATVLCVDKTGTLTLNKMTLKELICERNSFLNISDKKKLPEEFHEVVEFGFLSSQKEPFDPMEKSAKRHVPEDTLWD